MTSPLLAPTAASCKLNLFVYQEKMEGGALRVVGDKTVSNVQYPVTLNNHTQWVVNTIYGNDNRRYVFQTVDHHVIVINWVMFRWQREELSIGKITSNFTIILEVVPAEEIHPRATVAIDKIQLHQCFSTADSTCSYHQYRCATVKECINATSVCDFIKDCPSGDDERQNCRECTQITVGRM